MDGQRFDAIARAMACGASRRRVLHGAGAGFGAALVGALGLRPARGYAQGGPACRGFGDDCQGPDNPGQGNKCCAEFVCSNTGPGGGVCECPEGEEFCERTGTCYDPETECCFDAECDDGDVCNGLETCDDANACQPGTPLDCDDGDPCTTDSCDPVEGCQHVAVTCPGRTVCCARAESNHFGACVAEQACANS